MLNFKNNLIFFIRLSSICSLSLYFLFLAAQLNAGGLEYMYPVAVRKRPIDDSLVGSLVLAINQKSPTHLELWEWDSATKKIDIILLSRFTPAGLSLLPTEKGYSFIDNGIIRIKDFIKRSPATIELSEPLYDFVQLSWINDFVAYTSAKLCSHYGIFCIDREGTVSTIVWDGIHDYQYPQLIDENLFYVRRMQSGADYSYTLFKKSCQKIESFDRYSTCNKRFDFDSKPQEFAQISPTKKDIVLPTNDIVLDQINRPIVFLKMVNLVEGYYISHDSQIESKSLFLNMNYYKISNMGIKEDKWQQELLFSFELPTDLILYNSEDRLYESLLPFLPRHIGSNIYFSSTVRMEDSYAVSIFAYQESDKLVRPVKLSSNGLDNLNNLDLNSREAMYHFAPTVIETATGSQVIVGGSVDDQGGVRIWIDDSGLLRAEFISVQ